MKCLILAGGSGNRLWPLSRNNYPKQFINIINNHSLFQETIVRNMPFCDEFIIVTQQKYNFIVEGQLRMFQGLKYRCVFEEEPRKTSASVVLASMILNPSEQLLVVPADHIIDSGASYRTSILEAQKLSRDGHVVTFGLPPTAAHTGYGYIRHSGTDVLSFHEKPDLETAQKYVGSQEYLWNTGLYLFHVGDFLHQLSICNPDFYQICYHNKKKIIRKGYEVLLPSDLMSEIPALNIEYSFMEIASGLKVINSSFEWHYMNELEALCSIVPDDSLQNVIQNNSHNTTVINQVPGRLVVTNEVNDAIIVNTADATYISQKGSAFKIKQVIRENDEKYKSYFEDNVLLYRSWGTYEVLKSSAHYKVKKVTVFPGKSLTMHRHNHRSEHWAVVEGTAAITLEGSQKIYAPNDSIDVPIGTLHQISNPGSENLIIIETSVGEFLAETDIESLGGASKSQMHNYDIIKLEPAFQDYLWGGTRLRDDFGKNCDYDIIAESWELSAHPDGNSMIAEGPYSGMFFSDYLSMVGDEALGWKCKSFEKFPLLIKFIDAQKSLSVQVHPDDDYALKNEDEYGKNEMWYILDCEKDASLYFGFKQDATADEIQRRIENNTLLEILNEVPVSKGDVFFVRAGTVHAIGAGILICEIQQNSNCTYRLFDYGRTDKYGRPRELHLKKALDVADTKAILPASHAEPQIVSKDGYTFEKLGSCKYFACMKYTVEEKITLTADETSFISIVFLSGEGVIASEHTGHACSFKMGDSFFLPAGLGNVEVTGCCSFILTHI